MLCGIGLIVILQHDSGTARLRTTPTTAAVMVASAADSALLPSRVSTKGASRKIHKKHGTNVAEVSRHQDAGEQRARSAEFAGRDC
jgi:hypothetical protein